MKNQIIVSGDKGIAERAKHLCKLAEEAAQYLSGLADAFEATATGAKGLAMVAHLRHHAHELNMAPLYVMHGYTEVKGGAK